MKILVTCKRVPDPDQKIRLQADDAIAVEESLRIRETHGEPVEIVAIGIGVEECDKTLRTALAMGADRAVLIPWDSFLDPWNVSGILEKIIQRENPSLVLMGKQAVDGDSNQTGQMLAARLGWAQATFASRIEFQSGGKLKVERETDSGIETLGLNLPAIITADLRLNEPRYASLPSIMKARKKPIERIETSELGWAPDPKVEIINMSMPQTSRKKVRLTDISDLVARIKEALKTN